MRVGFFYVFKACQICSRGRNNKAIDSIQFLAYNRATRLVLYPQHILKDLELIFCDFFIISQDFFNYFFSLNMRERHDK